MGSISHDRNMKFLNPIEPLKGPDVPYERHLRSNPGLRGPWLWGAALLMENSRLVREFVWQNTGFNSLRKIIRHIEDYEPLFEPQIVPLPQPETDRDTHAKEDSTHQQQHRVQETITKQDSPSYPQAKYYSVDDYRELYLSGELTPLDVAETLLPLIRRDIPNPTPHSLAFFDSKIEKVLAAAKESTQRYKEKRSLGPLDGVPTAVKDEYDIDGYSTSLGSKNDYTGTIHEGDVNTAWCVRKLEAAGAIIIGKTSMHEFGLDTTGNNPVYGTPRNPHNKNYYTGGSSSGTGYAVSAGLIPVGLGSDGGGSIRIPASLCGVFGLKPTHGRLSFKPGQNHCITCACLGPIAADIKSLATVFQIISQPHPSSSFPALSPLRLTPASSTGPKYLGIPKEWISRSTPRIQALFNSLVATLSQAPHNYAPVEIQIPFLPEGQLAHALTVLTDAATLLPPDRSIKNLTAANRILLAIGRVTPATDYMLAQKLRRCIMQHLAWLWRTYPGMIILTPTTACEGLPIEKESQEMKWGVNDGDRTMKSMEYAWLANFCGLPGLSLPMGFVPPRSGGNKQKKGQTEGEGEIPVGVMATGEWCSEEGLLQFGKVVEGIIHAGEGILGGRNGQRMMHRPEDEGAWVDVIEEARKRRHTHHLDGEEAWADVNQAKRSDRHPAS
ncbi:Amidase signature domain containing protein [Naviculisporaceae sp. PSN 640]